MSDEAMQVDAAVVRAAEEVYKAMTHPMAPHLGTDYRFLIEVGGKPKAEVVRTIDAGIKIRFYA
jgi:hypothetical protein